jgi:hypothetical protein
VQGMARRVIDLAGRGRGDRDPLDVLEAVREARDQLEALETDCVRAALARGASWAAIGAALGVSRQAAHRRLAKRAAARDDDAAAA